MTWTITDLAAEFGITPRALRFYEEKGMLSPDRRGQARLYSKRDRARLKLILNGRDVGLTLYEIRTILDLYDGDEEGTARQYRHALGIFRRRMEAVKKLRDEADAQLARLETACRNFEARLSPKAEGAPKQKSRGARAA
ncbi:MAG: MerR family DNA-binding transcriptional regulator [Parvibaculum sp.]|uniref:MerR family transcriptional regulator n=1 Tax=Parvibaculum sp. TaxID=2024848 RepID=UPI00271D8095|nr:MerR family DNA-binding transcriptional regulator [Parvibaculum sp.]MDO8839079.1 MerR family DNA-binding transcriptional regulator [Parvibaculum sp.]MDP2124695.1 MerR family DNA-binding transcriptional regulator [Parvibaculum sp.]